MSPHTKHAAGGARPRRERLLPLAPGVPDREPSVVYLMGRHLPGGGRWHPREEGPEAPQGDMETPPRAPVLVAILASLSGAVCGFVLAGRLTAAAIGFLFCLVGFCGGFLARGLMSEQDAPSD